MKISFSIGAFCLLFTVYWCLLAKLVDAILESPRLNRVQWVLVGMLNTVLILGVWALWPSAQVVYCAMILIMLAEFVIFYKDKLAGALLCTFACAIHILACFLVTISIFSLTTNRAPFEFLANSDSFLMCCLIAFSALDFLILVVLKLVPLPMVKLLNQHVEQQWFMIAWMAVSCAFLLYMENLFHSPTYPAALSGTQIAAAIALLSGVYISLFFSIKTSTLLGYKEKNAALEQAIHKEQQYRSFMVRDALSSYEVNVTQDLCISGFESLSSEMGDIFISYTDMMILLSQRVIYSEDAAEFVRNHGRPNILRLFAKGERELVSEYRRVMEDGQCIWVRSIVNLVQDTETHDVKAFLCVKNIDDEKKNQLELQHRAERDPLTGLYNRSTVGKLIDEHLLFGQICEQAALFMIDVDKFKDINDHFGHVYGDAVLCELADKLTRVFRKNDIVGRIGGDEYIVFLKDGATAQMVETKALEICKAFYVTYQGGDAKLHTISASVGIALFPRDGASFQDLYNHADIALYAAKSEGKNGVRIYDGSSFAPYASHRTEIQSHGNVSQKGFRENRIEYVFKMLYQSENPVAAIHSVLELVTRHFSFERGYIFETSKDGKTTSNTFEWCAHGTTSEMENLQRIPIEAVATANAHFQRSGTFILKSLEILPEIERDVLEPQGIKSMFQFGIFDKSRLLGFIGFDNCRNEAVPTDNEVDEIKTICNILATFFVKQYVDEVSEKDLLARQEVMNHLENYIYVINTETFELLFMNEKVQTILRQAGEHTPCYHFFRGNDSQCADCPMRELNNNKTDHVISEVYNNKLDIWMEISASLMRWTDGNLACLINCSNITKQKEDHLHHVHELEQLIYVDAQVGCATYPKFQIDAQRILQQQPDALHCIAKLDIGNFKLVNQIYGYEKGNEILCCVAKALSKTMRSSDEVFARMANDEFVALFTIAQESEIDALNESFLTHFYHLVEHDFSFKCRFPHGRYLIPPGSIRTMTVNDMMEKANIAHKIAKLNRTVDYAFYDESMTKEALRVKAIENRMAQALRDNEFSVYLQPKYYLKNETIGGAEALTRWKNENIDLFFPNAFIPVFEQNGFITKLDFYIFEKTCRAVQDWIAQGLKPVTVSVNFSRLHLDNTDFVQNLCEIVDRVGIDRKYLEIEITETVIFDRIDTLEVLVDDIHKNGFTMSMDDFGSGYSSLGMLKDFPVDVIKMDRSFFANQRDAQRSKTVVGSIIQMASALGIHIVAEGVEEQSQIDFLRELNCDMVQGYYYAKPMPIDDFTALLRSEATQK